MTTSTGARGQSRGKRRRAQSPCADSSLIRKSEQIVLTLPFSNDEITVVVINGICYTREGVVRIVTRVAQSKYQESDFQRVDELIYEKGYGVGDACKKVADERGFTSVEGFARQYRRRCASKTKGMKVAS